MALPEFAQRRTGNFDLGAAATLDTWYSVSLSIDAVTGSFHSIVADTLTGTVLVDDVHTFAAWQPQFAAYDSIAIFGGETLAGNPPLPNSTTIANIAQVDNINIMPGRFPNPPRSC